MTTTLDPPDAPPSPTGTARLLAGIATAAGADRPGRLARHLATFGPAQVAGPALAAMAERAGLTGRGGAGFPTSRKLAAVGAARGPRVVVANGTEGEPLSAKDKTLLVHAPHLVLDGLDAAAAAVGADRRIICVEDGHPGVVAAVRDALGERGDGGVEVVVTPRRYVTGQETALVSLLDGGDGRPTLRRPFDCGVGGRPTLVDNVETLAHLALIVRFGADWYRSVGTAEDPGTALVTVGGTVRRAGVYEVEYGNSLRRLLAEAGANRSVRAVLVGGYYGRWLPAAALRDLTFERTSLAAKGASLGCGVVAVVDDRSCAVAELARVAAWFAASSAGQCGACTWGLRDLASATAALHEGSPDLSAAADISRWSGMVRGRGACRLPDGAAGFLESGMAVFSEEIDQHRSGRCTRGDNRLLPTPAQEAW